MILFIFTGIHEKANYPFVKPVLAKAGIRDFINNRHQDLPKHVSPPPRRHHQDSYVLSSNHFHDIRHFQKR
jgi:hypothetical protein